MSVQSSAPPASPAPATKKKWIRWVGLGCGTLIVLVAAFALVMTMVVKKATAGPEAVVSPSIPSAV